MMTKCYLDGLEQTRINQTRINQTRVKVTLSAEQIKRAVVVYVANHMDLDLDADGVGYTVLVDNLNNPQLPPLALVEIVIDHEKQPKDEMSPHIVYVRGIRTKLSR